MRSPSKPLSKCPADLTFRFSSLSSTGSTVGGTSDLVKDPAFFYFLLDLVVVTALVSGQVVEEAHDYDGQRISSVADLRRRQRVHTVGRRV